MKVHRRRHNLLLIVERIYRPKEHAGVELVGPERHSDIIVGDKGNRFEMKLNRYY